MWKALYDYNGDFPGSLSIKTNDKFLLLRKENEYWYLVARPDGLLGCVPVNYLAECSTSENNNLLSCINTALKSLNQDEAAVIHNRDNLIQELLNKKQKCQESLSDQKVHDSQSKSEDVKPGAQLMKKKSKRAPPAPPVRADNSVQQPPVDSNILSQVPEAAAPVVPPSNVPPGLAFSLLESLRVGTGAPHKRCLNTLHVLLDTLTESVPNLRLWTEAIEAQLQDSDEATLQRYYEESADWETLTELFHYFEQRKNDSQERSWALHEQETDLVRQLGHLHDTLDSADRGMIRHCLHVEEFKSLTSLIQLYQMERRLSLRRLYLRTFLTVCKVEPKAISVCLYSVLPLEIIRDLSDTTTDLVSCTLSQLLLTLLMANSKDLPTELTEKLSVELLALILSRMSCDSTCNESAQGPDLSSSTNGFSTASVSSFVNEMGENGDMALEDLSNSVTGLLLAYNCHLDNPRNNRLMQCLRGRQELARYFTEKIIHSFNRLEDPACIIKPESASFDKKNKTISPDCTFSRQNSVRKFLCDLYSSSDTADLVYRNDTEVIIDVINRQLCDLPITSPELSEYLVLLDLIATNSDYKNRGAYKRADLQQSLRIIAAQDEDAIDSVRDLAQLLVTKLN